MLLLSAFVSLGVFISSAVEEPVAAAMITFGALLLLKIIDWSTEVATETKTGGVMRYLSMSRHYEPLLGGRFSSSDVLYFVILTLVCLALAIWRLDADRLHG
jgi:ABC-2 type transport system permease protein